jgi:LmbE family N-acetylglucosaminyl deacetylase
MFSRIQDLPRFKADYKRFALGLQGASDEAKVEGQQLLESLIRAIEAFDGSTLNLIVQNGPVGHRDHASAQEFVQKSKEAMEMWMARHAPGVHNDEFEFSEPTTVAVDLDK